MSSSTVSLSAASESSNIFIDVQTILLSKKERVIKLVHAIALTVFSLGIALLFESVCKMFIEAWTGRTVKEITPNTTEIPPPAPYLPTMKPRMDDISLTFQSIQEKTAALEFHYTDRPVSRFCDIKCPEETVVKVENQEIHGNWVRMPDGNTYIATQAPTYRTTGLFWLVAFQNQGVIVDITTPRDNIPPYYPSEGTEFYVGARVELKNTEEIADQFTLYTYAVFNGQEAREVQRLHFSGWVDFDGTSIETLERLLTSSSP